jgi:hypothetical protein
MIAYLAGSEKAGNLNRIYFKICIHQSAKSSFVV